MGTFLVFIMQIGKISDIFPKKNLKNVPLRIFEIVWLGVVIELMSSSWKVIATCADSYITDIFFSCNLEVCNLLVDTHKT